MVNITNFIKYYILLYIIINIFIQQQNCYEYNIEADKKESTLDYLKINNFEECDKLIPSLFYPILILHREYGGGQSIREDISIKTPILEDDISGTLYYINNKNILDGFQVYFIKYIEGICYFGLSMNYQNETSGLNENEVLLSTLKENNKITQKVFSFDKISLNGNKINTKLYFGEVHKDFTSNDGFIGTCKSNEEDNFWGCSFNQMIINNKTLSLRRSDNKFYKIYLMTEEYYIKFPRALIGDEDIKQLFDQKCEYKPAEKKVECNNFLNEKDYIPLKLISDNLNITLELDKFNRYFSSNNNDKEIINITLSSEINYIIFPLIMFKQFHVQFDAEKNVINFYTKDSSILQVKEEKKETPNNEEGSSSGFNAFLIILIILLILGIGFGIFYFLRLRKNKVEKDINRFTKFEDEEDFKNMNENKVY